MHVRRLQTIKDQVLQYDKINFQHNTGSSMPTFQHFFLPLFFTLLAVQFQLKASQTFIYLYCFDDYNPTTDQTYDTNVKLLLSSISNNTTGNNTSSYTDTIGNSPNKVSGVFQCRGDLAAEDCKKCAQTATTDMIIRCPSRKQIFIWYDECWLHYSNNHSISTMLSQPTDHFNWGNNVSNAKQFMPKLHEFLNELVVRAVDKSSNLFVLDKRNVTNSQTIHGLVQCTQDVSRRNCGRCLREAVAEIPICCDHKDGLRILKPSCIVWYEVYNFFESDYFTAIRPPLNPETIKGDGKLSKSAVILIVILTITVVVFACITVIFFCLRRNKEIKIAMHAEGISTVESLQFKFGTVLTATDDFSDANKLGEGDFGAVYKGNLASGRQIVVKRLAENSDQGAKEFKNEILLLAKLQHRNLVRLLGFCLKRNEKLLIYEYVANTSLEHLLFDGIESTFLDWKKRYNIIGGIARGLLYLHEESRDRVIHRDLKARNVLIDEEMNPKISDFGMARLFPTDHTHVTTDNVVGTHGYMAPECALHGHFSVKSDVFSFGVLVLEIVTGEKNSSFNIGERGEDLLSYAWGQWKKGTLQDLLEPALREHCSTTEVMRCIHIGLLCVQEDVAKRPTMESVVLMLSSISFTLTLPSPPPFLGTKSMNSDINV